MKVPGLPIPIENMILRYVESKANWWTFVSQLIFPLLHTNGSRMRLNQMYLNKPCTFSPNGDVLVEEIEIDPKIVRINPRDP